MVDFTIAHVTSASHCGTPIEKIIAAKTREKSERYVGSGMIHADEFVVAVALSCGAFHEDLVSFLREVSIEAVVDFDDLVKSTRNCVMWGQGAAVVAAFRLAGAVGRRGRAREGC
jgi:hypothetical protein